ncbi:hypothetical protein AB0B01_01485 [Streptomyces sp. NPDC044571]
MLSPVPSESTVAPKTTRRVAERSRSGLGALVVVCASGMCTVPRVRL